jgi:AraC-like DNA-binding protein
MTQRIEKISPIQQLLEAASAVIGLSVCYHDRLHNSGLPLNSCKHLHPACLKVKNRFCLEFDAFETHQALRYQPDGRIHVCPHGFTEIAIPVFIETQFAGVLFAGPCWMGKVPPPYPELYSPDNKSWLEERRTMLQAVSSKLCLLIQFKEKILNPNPSRKIKIIDFLKKNQNKKVTMSQLASELSLSSSRASHLVNSLFNMSLPNLVNALKLEQAEHLLSATELPVGEIAESLGFNDQNYFSRLFSKKHGISPMAYRQRYPFEA